MSSLLAALHRFHSAFGQVEDTSGILQEFNFDPHAHMDLEAIVEWTTDCVYTAFTVQLNPLERLYFTLDMAENSTISSRCVSTIIFIAVILSVVCWIAGTVEGVRVTPCEGVAVNTCIPKEPEWMEVMETVCVWIFTAEVAARLFSVGAARRELLNQRYLIALIAGDLQDGGRGPHHSWCSRFLSFIISPSAIFDILSVVPYWLEMIMTRDFEASEISALRMLYLVRVTRVFKLGRALNADLGQLNEVHDLFRKVLINASPAIMMSFMLILLALFFFGTFIFFFERGTWVGREDPRYQVAVAGGGQEGAWVRASRDGTSFELSPFDSIPSAFWWTIVTITTVGYGDQVPYTPWGKCVGSVAMLYGTVILGLPLFVVGATFGQEYDRLMKAEKRRMDMLNSREGRHTLERGDAKTEAYMNATRSFIDEYVALLKVFEEHCPVMGIPPELAVVWLNGLQAALMDPMTAVAMDRLSVRVLGYVADVEEMSMAMRDGPERVASCRKARAAWHRLSITCCQLSSVPRDVFAQVFTQLLEDPAFLEGGGAKTSQRVSTCSRGRPAGGQPGSPGGRLHRGLTRAGTADTGESAAKQARSLARNLNRRTTI